MVLPPGLGPSLPRDLQDRRQEVVEKWYLVVIAGDDKGLELLAWELVLRIGLGAKIFIVNWAA